MLKVIYSIDARLGASGVGYTGYNAAMGLYQADVLARLFVGSNAQTIIPSALIRQWGIVNRGLKYLGAKDSSGLIYYFDSMLFDAWVAAQLPKGDIFHSWHGHSLWSLRKAKQKTMVTVIERASSHPATAAQLLREEYQRWNVPLRLPMWNHQRLLQEITEADYITIPSDFVRQSMIAGGVPERKLIEIPFGADLDQFSPSPATMAHPFRVIFAGQVSIRKGVPYLMEAWRQLQWSDAELWIVGGITPDFAALYHRWADLAGVKFWGHSAELPRLFQQGDAFVFPSIEEGSALVTYEAMACGLPVITTFNAGSVIRDGEDGLLVPIRDVGALCESLQHLRDEAAFRQQMGQAARERVAQFTWQAYRSQLVGTYYRIQNK
jgi:glycosyltransferase involved in cell wall biosynthesis